jgi:hypothetical protein
MGQTSASPSTSFFLGKKIVQHVGHGHVKPYVVAAMLDNDMSVNQTGKLAPTSGGLMSAPSLLEQEEVVIGSGADLELNLTFKYLVE